MPGSVYLPRGEKTVRKLIELAQRLDKRAVLIICTVQAEPRELRFLTKEEEGWRWSGFAPTLSRVVLARDLGFRISKQAVGIFSETAGSYAKVLSELTGLPVTNDSELPVMRVERDRIEFLEQRLRIGPLIEIERWESGQAGADLG